MTDEQPLGPGALILVVGPSGAGKDTLIDIARSRLAGRPDVHFAQRVVTRAPGVAEANRSISDQEFAAAVAAGAYPLHWQAHGLSYALGSEVRNWITAGHVVVANGSRATLPLARARFARTFVVLVTAPLEVRAHRLAMRGREGEAEIRERLQRAPQADVNPDLTVDNMGIAVKGGERLVGFIAAVAAAGPAAG